MLAVMEKHDNQGDTQSPLIRPAEAANISGLTPGGLAKMADRGDLTLIKPSGTHRRYSRVEIEALAKPVTGNRP